MHLYKFISFKFTITSNETCNIRSDAPVIVTGFGLHFKCSSMGDSSKTIVPWRISQCIGYYKISVLYGYDHNYVSIIINLASKDSFRINGTIIDSRDFIFEGNGNGNVTYNVRSKRVVEGELTASNLDRECFVLMFAGVREYEAYRFSGNYLLLWYELFCFVLPYDHIFSFSFTYN